MHVVAEEERRTVDRFDIETDGQVILPSGARIPFTIADISKRGAKLKLKQMLVLPSEFVIDVTSPDRKKVKRCDCQRSWQKQGLVGVKFTTARVITLDNYVS